jgi:hypothetical protein
MSAIILISRVGIAIGIHRVTSIIIRGTIRRTSTAIIFINVHNAFLFVTPDSGANFDAAHRDLFTLTISPLKQAV